VTDATIQLLSQAGPERDDDEPGGPARPGPGHLPPEPEPETAPDPDEDEPGGPAHPAPGHLPPEPEPSHS
jgi:hypothetical protein